MGNTYLAIYPNIRGFGYAYVEMPGRLVAQGMIECRKGKAEKQLKKIEDMISFYQPDILVIRDGNTTKSPTLATFINQVVELAIANSVQVHQYNWEQVKAVFGKSGEITKVAIADKIIREWLPELESLRPRPRGKWLHEDYHMGIFDALSLIMAHEFLG